MDIMKTSLSSDMTGRIQRYFEDYWDVLAEVLCIHVPDDADGAAFVAAQVITDYMTGRTLADPGHRTQDYVTTDGFGLSDETQNKIATAALSIMPFWGGYSRTDAKSVFSRVIKHATGEDLERIRCEVREAAEAIRAEKAAAEQAAE